MYPAVQWSLMMSPMGFEPMLANKLRPKHNALDHSAKETLIIWSFLILFLTKFYTCLWPETIHSRLVAAHVSRPTYYWKLIQLLELCLWLALLFTKRFDHSLTRDTTVFIIITIEMLEFDIVNIGLWNIVRQYKMKFQITF